MKFNLLTLLCLISLFSFQILEKEVKLYPVQSNEKWGYVNQDGKEVIKTKYSKAYSFSNELALVKKKEEYFFIKKDGSRLNKESYSKASSFSEGKAFVAREGESPICINTKGKELFKLDNVKIIAAYNEGIAVATSGSKTLWYNEKGEIIGESTKNIYNWGSNKLMPFQKKTQKRDPLFGSMKNYITYGFVNHKDSIIIPAIYSRVGAFQYNRVSVENNNLGGVIDHLGEVKIPIKLKRNGTYCDSLIFHLKDGKYGYLDLDLNIVIPYKYDLASNFSDGLANVTENGVSKFINTKGEVVLTPDPALDVTKFVNGISVFIKEDKFGFINTSGEIVLKPKYDDINLGKLRIFCK